MSKQLIKSKTITFIFIMAFILTFKAIFGDENVLIAVTTITALLMLLERDLTINPIKYTAKLVALNLTMGIIAYIASNNMWIAIPLNFIIMFSLGYTLCYNLHKQMYLPFGLQYLFILSQPVSLNEMPLRLMSLLVGAILIMVSQLIVNKNKVSKTGNKILSGVCSNLLIKLDDIKNNKYNIDVDKSILEGLASFKKIIYDKRSESFYLTEEARIKLNLSAGLEKIYILIKRLNYNDDLNQELEDVGVFVEKIKGCFDDEEKIKTLDKDLQTIFSKYDTEKCDIKFLSVLFNIKFIYESFRELDELGSKHYNLIDKFGEIPKSYKKSSIANEKIGKYSMKFKYAMRIAIAISVGGFLVDYFNLEEGRWILFTIFSLTSPIYETSKQKSKDRILATIIGSVIIIILFGITKNTSIRSLIIMLNGYISGYLNEYRYTTITTTVSAIGSAALLGGTEILSITRILFVIIGVILALIINKFIFPYKFEDSQKELKSLYDDTIKQMLKLVYGSVGTKKYNNTIKNLFIVTTLIEEKIKLNNQLVKDSIEEKYILDKRILVINIYELYLWVSDSNIKDIDMQYILEDLNSLSQYEVIDIEKSIQKVEEHFNSVDDINDKIILHSVLDIFTELKTN